MYTIWNWYINPYALILFLFCLVDAWVILHAWRQRALIGKSPSFVLTGILFWTLSYAIATGVHNLPERLLWAKIQHVGIALTAAALPVAILSYLGREKWIRWWTVLLFSLAPAADLVLVWTNELHHLIWRSVELKILGSLGLLDITYGPYFLAFIAYNSLILLFGMFMFLRIALSGSHLERTHAGILFISTLFPGVALGLNLARLNPLPDLDLMPLGYSLCAWTLAWGALRFHLFNLVPVARDTIVDNMSDGVLVVDKRGWVVDANPALLKMISSQPEQVIGRPVEQVFIGQSALVKQYSELEEVQTQLAIQDGELTRHYELRISPLNDRKSLRHNRIIVVRETTEHNQVEEALRKANAQLQETVAELEHRNQEMILLNELEDLMKLCETPIATYEVISSSAPRFFPSASGFLAVPDDDPDLMKVVVSWGQVPDRMAFRRNECKALQDGRVHTIDPNLMAEPCDHMKGNGTNASVCVPMQAMRGDITGILHVSQSDPAATYESLNLMLVMAVSDSIAAALTNLHLRETLRQLSIRDPLTNLFNRRYMEETFAREIMRAERDQYLMGVIMFDIDHFKLINDRFGHPAGDTVLKDLGELMLAFIRGGDVACRYGGEEFVLILPEAGLEDAFQKAEQLRQKVKQLRWSFLGHTAIGISISIGVAAYPQHGKTVAEVLDSVDKALYRAKQAGRDRVML